MGGVGAWVGVWLLVVLAATCGGGDEAADLTFSTDLDQGKPLAALSTDEVGRLCATTSLWAARAFAFERLHEPLCRRWAATAAVLKPTTTDAALEASCRESYDHCLMQTSLDLGGPARCLRPDTRCTATVGQYQACVNALETDYAAALADVRHCEDLTRGRAAAVPPSSLPLPAVCNALLALCPGAALPLPPALTWMP